MPFYVVIVITLTLVVAICMRHSMYWYEAGGKEEEEMSSSRSTWMNEVQLLIGFPISQQHHQHYKPWWGGDKKWCACFQSKLWAIKYVDTIIDEKFSTNVWMYLYTYYDLFLLFDIKNNDIEFQD